MKMNRNQIIGTIIGKVMGYAVQVVIYKKAASVLNPQSVILLRSGTKYGLKFIRSTAKNYARIGFSSEKIFFEAIGASFFAD